MAYTVHFVSSSIESPTLQGPQDAIEHLTELVTILIKLSLAMFKY